MIIYITGKSGSGKSTLAKQLAKKLDYSYISMDEIAHKVYENQELIDKAYQLFGTSINDDDGKFNRKKLGNIVFRERHSKRVKAFSDLTWKHMEKLLDDEIVDNSVVEWILLPHTKYWARCALRILIKADDCKRYARLIARDNISKEYVELREKASIEYNEAEFDFVFNNTYETRQIEENVKVIKNFMANATQLTVLGTQSPFSKECNACPSFMVSDDEYNLLLDCGSGSHRFFDMHRLNNLGIYISHLHRDHYNDIYNYMYSSFVMNKNGALNNPLKIFLPPEPDEIYRDISQEKLTYSTTEYIDENKKITHGKFDMEFLETIHSQDVKSFAIKIKTKNKLIVYTGDCSYKCKDSIINFAKDADMLICEASFLTSYGFQNECNHLTAYQAGEIASKANVKKLLLCHFWPEENTKNYYQEAKQIFDNVFIAKEKDVYLI